MDYVPICKEAKPQTLLVLTSIGPFIVAMVALAIAIWGDWFRSLYSHADVNIENKTIELDPEELQVHGGQENQKEEMFPLYIHLRIKNFGNIAAEGVEVYLSSLKKKVADEYQNVQAFIPFSLIWRHYNGIRLDKLNPNTSREIPLGYLKTGGIDRTLDVGNIDVLGVANVPFCFELGMLKTTPNLNRGITEPGTYRFDLEISASNIRHPKLTKIEITFSDKITNNYKDLITEAKIY
jgi:hypothetical protein